MPQPTVTWSGLSSPKYMNLFLLTFAKTYKVHHVYWPAFDISSFLSQFIQEKVRHLIFKACTVAFESSYEKGRKSVMTDSR